MERYGKVRKWCEMPESPNFNQSTRCQREKRVLDVLDVLVCCRWYSCTNGFLELFDAIRGLHMQLNAMGVAKEPASVHGCASLAAMSY